MAGGSFVSKLGKPGQGKAGAAPTAGFVVAVGKAKAGADQIIGIINHETLKKRQTHSIGNDGKFIVGQYDYFIFSFFSINFGVIDHTRTASRLYGKSHHATGFGIVGDLFAGPIAYLYGGHNFLDSGISLDVFSTSDL
jgi:hypothetical protein